MNGFLLRPARPDDASALTAIAHAAKRHWGYPEEWLRRWVGALTLTPPYLAAHPTWLADENGGAVGFYALHLSEEQAQLDHLWVLPAAMGRGIGRHPV